MIRRHSSDGVDSDVSGRYQHWPLDQVSVIIMSLWRQKYKTKHSILMTKAQFQQIHLNHFNSNHPFSLDQFVEAESENQVFKFHLIITRLVPPPPAVLLLVMVCGALTYQPGASIIISLTILYRDNIKIIGDVDW